LKKSALGGTPLQEPINNKEFKMASKFEQAINLNKDNTEKREIN
jgi:hypothetical protein